MADLDDILNGDLPELDDAGEPAPSRGASPVVASKKHRRDRDASRTQPSSRHKHARHAEEDRRRRKHARKRDDASESDDDDGSSSDSDDASSRSSGRSSGRAARKKHGAKPSSSSSRRKRARSESRSSRSSRSSSSSDGTVDDRKPAAKSRGGVPEKQRMVAAKKAAHRPTPASPARADAKAKPKPKPRMSAEEQEAKKREQEAKKREQEKYKTELALRPKMNPANASALFKSKYEPMVAETYPHLAGKAYTQLRAPHNKALKDKAKTEALLETHPEMRLVLECAREFDALSEAYQAKLVEWETQYPDTANRYKEARLAEAAKRKPGAKATEDGEAKPAGSGARTHRSDSDASEPAAVPAQLAFTPAWIAADLKPNAPEPAWMKRFVGQVDVLLSEIAETRARMKKHEAIAADCTKSVNRLYESFTQAYTKHADAAQNGVA